ncbi:MAG: YHS domain protein [Deltaproteobacteria bacterium]|nr:YHS domain protein [Deltaproteobacteria bacterium]
MKMHPFRLWLTLMLGFGLAAAAMAQPPTTSGGSGQALLNLENTVALHGYDPVAYFADNEAVRGNKRILERLGGATYYFASRGSRYEFLRDAPRYQPQFGGYCAASLAMGRLEDINPHLFVIYDGKLYLFNNPQAEAIFMRDPRRVVYEARQHYFKIASDRRSTY